VLVGEEPPGLLILGKQAIDADRNQTGQMQVLAADAHGKPLCEANVVASQTGL
jgi:electron transfer flavoprotein alpha/beta subunit